MSSSMWQFPRVNADVKVVSVSSDEGPARDARFLGVVVDENGDPSAVVQFEDVMEGMLTLVHPSRLRMVEDY